MTTHLHPSAIQHARDHLTRIPRPDRASIEQIRQWAKTQGKAFDPDSAVAVTLHYKPGPEGGWLAQVVEQMPLSQAVLSKWQSQPDSPTEIPTDAFSALDFLALHKAWDFQPQSWLQAFAQDQVKFVDKLPEGGLFGTVHDYATYQGLFRKTEPMRYSHETQIDIDSTAFQAFIWALDFHAEFIAQLDDYWAHQQEDYTTLLQAGFVAACNKQVEEGSLSEAGCDLAWRAAGIASDDETSPFEARMLNIYGYQATDIPCLTDSSSGLTLLYIPGNASPLHEFESQDAMKAWLLEQCQDALKRKALMAHFRLADLQDGLSYSGLETALKGLASYQGTRFQFIDNLVMPVPGWSASYINFKADQYSPAISGSLFQHMALQQQQRSYADAAFLISSNSDVIKARWRGYLNLTLTLIAPLALVIPGLGWVVAIGGIAQLGMGLDEIITGRNLQDKTDGALNVAFGALCALPLVGQAWSGGKRLFQTQLDAFVPPGRVNGQVGYLLSPEGAPKVRWTGKNFNRFFEQPAEVAPLTAQADGPAISRSTTHAGMDTLTSTHDAQASFVYDLDMDAFVEAHDAQGDSPTRYIARNGHLDAYEPILDGPRVVTDEMRRNTLRTLGIELALPAEVPRVPAVNMAAVPNRVIQLWIGEETLSTVALARISRNSRLLQDAGYGHCLYLSTQNSEVFLSNSRALAGVAPDVQVLPLEQQRFFQDMGYTRQFYEAAMTGPQPGSSHLTAANDMLKYHALYHEGGVYMDIDNDLLATPSHPAADGIINDAAPNDWIANVPLRTTHEGLLLEQPTSNPFRGIHQQYNTSVIGSHPNNPTLREVIREMQSRLDARPKFFTQKQNWPTKGAHAPSFARYAKALSELTGPGMFNPVIDSHLPAFRQMKQIYKLLGCPLLRPPTLLGADLQPVTHEALQSTLQSLFSVSRVVRVNNGFGWRNLNL